MKFLRQWAPELCLLYVAFFFGFRELATFPASWEDSGLYTMVAKMVANGHGYALPILDHQWRYPYFLSVGPTVILPVAFLIRLFGFSLETVRIVPVLYLLGTAFLFYIYALRSADRSTARWSAALLISFSAFVNTGKPVQGSVAAFFFLFLALLCMRQIPAKKSMAVLTGVFLGLSILTKLTFILVLPAFAIGLVRDYASRRAIDRNMFIVLGIACVLPLPWLLLGYVQQEGFVHFLSIAFSRSSNGNFLIAFLSKLPLLLRFQYQYFLLLFACALVGFRKGSFRATSLELSFLTTLFFLFFMHFLLREGWYRHLLLAHLLLLLFVPAGIFSILGKRWGMVFLSIFIVAQGLWQLDHRGSSRSTAAIPVAAYIQNHFADKNVLIRHPEIFIRLPENSHWLYYPLPGTEELIPHNFTELSAAQSCYTVISALSDTEKELYRTRTIPVSGKYVLVQPPENCAGR